MKIANYPLFWLLVLKKNIFYKLMMLVLKKLN